MATQKAPVTVGEIVNVVLKYDENVKTQVLIGLMNDLGFISPKGRNGETFLAVGKKDGEKRFVQRDLVKVRELDGTLSEGEWTWSLGKKLETQPSKEPVQVPDLLA